MQHPAYTGPPAGACCGGINGPAVRMSAHLRLHHDVLDDPKLRRIAASAGLPFALVLGAWSTVLVVASKARSRGSVADLTPARLAELAELGEPVAADLLAKMRENALLTPYRVRNWEKRQSIKVDHTAAERKRRQRLAAKGIVTPVTNVTPVTPAEPVTPVTNVTPCHGVTKQTPINRTTTTDASTLRSQTEVSLSKTTEVEAERRASAPKRGRFFGWLIGESSNA